MVWGCLQLVFHVIKKTAGNIKLPHFGLSDLPTNSPLSGHEKTREARNDLKHLQLLQGNKVHK